MRSRQNVARAHNRADRDTHQMWVRIAIGLLVLVAWVACVRWLVRVSRRVFTIAYLVVRRRLRPKLRNQAPSARPAAPPPLSHVEAGEVEYEDEEEGLPAFFEEVLTHRKED